PLPSQAVCASCSTSSSQATFLKEELSRQSRQRRGMGALQAFFTHLPAQISMAAALHSQVKRTKLPYRLGTISKSSEAVWYAKSLMCQITPISLFLRGS